MLSAHRLEWARYERRASSRRRARTAGAATARGCASCRRRARGAYEVTLEMGAPFPSTLTAPEVLVTANDGVAHRFTLDREVRPCVRSA